MFKNVYINRSMPGLLAAVVSVAVMVIAGCVTVPEEPEDLPFKPDEPQVKADVPFISEWGSFEDRIWVGNEMWAGDFASWQLKSGRLFCKTEADAFQRVALIARKITDDKRRISFRVKLDHTSVDPQFGAAGFLLGMPSPNLDGSSSKKSDAAGIFAGITPSGELVIKTAPTLKRLREELHGLAASQGSLPESTDLLLTAVPVGDRYTLLLQSFESDTRQELARQSFWNVPAALLHGYPGLACVSQQKDASLSVMFDSWEVEGADMIAAPDDESEIGPIVGVWHTIDRGRLHMTVQLMPVGCRLNVVKLQFFDDGHWQTEARSDINSDDFRAEFLIDKLDVGRDHPYRIEYGESLSDGSIRYHYRSGTIASKGALDAGELVVAEQGLASYYGYAPRPDVYVFYDVPLPAHRDENMKMLQEWYHWCFANREAGRDTPCLGVFRKAMTYRRARIEVAETADEGERDLAADWEGWVGADMKLICAPDMFLLVAKRDDQEERGSMAGSDNRRENKAQESAESGTGYVKINSAKRTLVYNRQQPFPNQDRSCAGWPIRCKQSAAYDCCHMGYLSPVEIMGRPNAVVQVVDENTGRLVYSVRSGGSVLLPRIFRIGHYTLVVGEPETGSQHRFGNLTPRTPEKSKAIRVAL